MPRRVAMSTIRTRCQQRADAEGDAHIATAEWNAIISEKYGELYGLVVEAGSRYFETTQAITATGATSYTEPTDHHETVGLDYLPTGAARRALRNLRASETNAFASLTGEAHAFAHIDAQIYLYPNPSS